MSFFTKNPSGQTPAQTQTAPRQQRQTSPSMIITGTSGKQYSLDNNTVNWIKSRYKNDLSSTYGLDDADQLAKRNGQLSASALKTYKNSNVDRQLAELGLPSEKNLEKYLESYNQWHTGGMDQVFGQMNLPKNYWTNVKGWYQSDMQNAYENTAEDQQRKARGIMPSKWEAKYTDTEIDDQLRARGLPPISEFKTYAGRWDNYQGIENFYANVARNETNLRLAGVKDDSTVYPYDGEEYTGKDLYVKAFYDELNKKNDDGSYVYGAIRPMFKNSSTKETTPTGDFAYDEGAKVLAENKNAVSDEDYANYNAFSYDDYKSKYDDLYNRYFAGQTLSNGQTVNDALTVQAREEDAEALRDYFKSGAKEPAKFTAQYFAEHPDATPETLFLDMEANNVTDTEAYEVYETMKKEAKGTNAWYDVVNGWSKTYGGVWSNVNESDAPIPDVAKPLTDEQRDAQAEKDRVKAAQQYSRAMMNGDSDALAIASDRAKNLGYNSIEDMTVALKEAKSDEYVKAVKDAIAVYESAMAAYEDTYPGYGAPSAASREPIDKATAALNALGFKSVHDATRYVGGAREADPQKFVRENTAAMNDYVDNAPAPSEEAVTTARNAIEAALIDDNGPMYSSVDAVIRVLDGIAENSANAAAYWQALEDLGFTDLSGMADDLTADWSDADKRKLKYHIGGNNFLEMTDGEDSANNDWSAVGSARYSQQLNSDKFSRSLEWVLQQVNAGKMTEADGYQLLAANGFQNEMEEYIGDEWHKAHFIENTAPGLYAQAEETDRLLWEEMTPEEQRAAAEDLWNNLSDEQKASMYGNDWWKFDPTVYRTFGQALEQQFQAVLPGLGAEIISTPVKVLDAIEANLSGRPDMWETTQDLMAFQQKMGNLGAVADNVNGAGVAQTAADVVQEIGRMYFYGSIGGAIGAGFAGTSAGAAVMAGSASNSMAVRGASKMFMSMVKSSPFVVSAFANNYAEAKELGAPNNEATWFALITGLSEGILEGFEFDELWGKALGQGNFAKQLALGKHTYMQNLGIVGKAWISSMAVSGLGEFTEESIGYVLETFLKMRHSDTWGKGTEWSASDWLQQAMMGFITGALGGGLAAGGSWVADGVKLSNAMKNNPQLQAALPDVLASIGIAESVPDSTMATYREGGATIMSKESYDGALTALKSCTDAAQNNINEYKKVVAAEDLKLENRLRELDSYAAKVQSIDTSTGKGAKELANLVSSKLGVKLDMAQPLAPQVKAAFKASVDSAVRAHDTAVSDIRASTETALQNSEMELQDLQKKFQEHYVGLYLQNEGLLESLSKDMLTNLAQAYQNGAEYDPEEAAKQRKETESKLAEAEANETMAEAEQVAQTPVDAATKARELAYDRVYKDQEAGKAYAEGRRGENDSKMTRVEFAENERQNFQAKTTARLRGVTLELAGLEAKDGMSAKEIFEEAKKAMTPEAAQKLDMYQKLSKALGLNMVVRDVVAGTSGYVHDGKLYVTLNGKQSMLRVAAHELTHYMKGHASEQYDALRTSLVNEVGQEKFDQLLQEKAQEYGLDLNDAKARVEADDEVCAELCEKMLENKDALERFVQSDLDAAKTLKARLGKTLVAIKSAIRSIGTSNAETKADLIKQQDTIEQWYKGLSDAIDNANKAGKTTATTEAETATVADTTTEAPQAPPVETNPDLFMGEEAARREQLRTDLEALAKKGTKVQDVTRQEVNDVLDRVILGDKSNYNKADYAQIRGMLAQLIPEVQAYVNGDESVDADALNERVNAAIDYMLERYGEGSEDYYNLRELIPSKIALTDTAYKDLRAKDMTLRQASNELTKALGGKFVNFVYKKAPSYNNAMTIDELWQAITDQYGEQNGVGNIGEDALALIDYVRERADNRTSFNDLYGSQREDMVNTQVGEFLDAVQDMMSNKASEESRHMLDYIPGELDEDAIDEAFIEDIDESFFENEINKILGTRPIVNETTVTYDKSVDAQGSKLSDEQVDYFQDSKVRSKDGQLRPVYHYTNGTFTEFKPMPASEHSNRTLGDGYYVSVLPTEYQAFGKNRMVMYANITNPFEMEMTPEQAAYVYDKYAAPFHEDKFGLYREHAIDSLQSFTKSMDYLREYADANGIGTSDILRDLGFDGIHDGPDWVAFDSNQLKFTDNKTPTTSNDLRFAVDDDLVNQYGAIEQGREPRARDVQVPRQVDDRTRVSKLARSAAESPIMSDEHAEKIMNDIEADKDRVKKVWSYIPKSNDEMAQKARDFIADKQPASAQREFHDMVTSGNTSLLTEAVGLQLLADAAMRDDWVSVDELLFDLRVLATDAGQRSQIFNTLKELKGIGSAWYLEKLVAKLNTQYADAIRTGEIDGPITVSDAAMQQVRAAKTQAEVDAAEAVVAKELAVQLPLTWDEKLSNWRFLSMLGNPITHVRNFTGNKLMYGMGGMKDVVAAGVQRLLENTGITDASDRAHALLTPADRKYWDSFVQKSYEEQRSNLQGGGKLGFQSLLQQSKRSFDNKVLDTIARGKNPGVMSDKGRVAGLIENIKNNGAMGMLEVADAWGLEDNYKRSLTEYMKAQGYELRNGVVGKVGKDGSFTEISTEAMNKAIEWASSQAWTNTFRGPSEFATALNKISKINPVMRLVVEGVMPFKKTPVNIAKQGAMYSPAGIVIGTTELLTKVKQGKMSAATAIDHLSSGLTGTALMALGVVLAKAGILRGGGEDKKKLETYLEDTGDQTYAFKFGNVSINMSAIAPATIPLFMGVALQEMLSRNGEDEGVDLSTITDVLAGTLNPFMEMSFMSSLNSALKNYNNEGIGGALGSTIMTAAQNYGSQYLPTLGGKVAQFVDPTQRTTKSSATSPVGGNLDYYWRSLVKKVPGAEATLQPDVNIWGQTTTKDSFGDWALDFANKFILPTNVKVTNRDAVDNELIRVVESTGIADFLPSDGNKYFTVKGEKYKMNASQYTEYSKDRGQAAYAALKDVMAGASYKTATDEQKAELLKKALDNAYKQVNNVWKEKLGAYDK